MQKVGRFQKPVSLPRAVSPSLQPHELTVDRNQIPAERTAEARFLSRRLCTVPQFFNSWWLVQGGFEW